jgi:hypothetical protein
LEIVALDVICFELLQVALEVVIEEFGCHFTLKTCSLIRVGVRLLLKLDERLVILRCCKLH